MDDTDWFELTRRIARSVQTTIGWIFWDPGAIERYTALGAPGPLGYLASRSAPLAGAGPKAVTAAFGSISPFGIAMAFEVLGHDPARFEQIWQARDAAVLHGLRTFAPAIEAPLVDHAADLWTIVDQLPLVGRTFFGAHVSRPRPDDSLLSGWHAVNCLREWRGDTHWAIVMTEGLTHPEASILHNAWLGYEGDWLANSRGTSPDDLAAGWASLERKGLAIDHVVQPNGIALRQRIEDLTDQLTVLPWQLLGAERTAALADALEPPCELLLRRVDETAGVNYQPASRIRPPRTEG